jgi:hypothetical protein
MVIAYLLICLIPVALILLVLGAIGAAAMKTVRKGKRIYAEMRPDINDLKEKATRARQKGLEFSERGKKLSEAFEEIGGRWAFVSKSMEETAKSPLVKLAGMAGKHAGGKKES